MNKDPVDLRSTFLIVVPSSQCGYLRSSLSRAPEIPTGEALGAQSQELSGRGSGSIVLASLRRQNEQVLEGLEKSVDRLSSSNRIKDDWEGNTGSK